MCTGPHSLLSPQEATGWTPSWIRCWVGASLPKRTKNSHQPFWNHPRNKPHANLLQCLNVHHHWREGMAFTSRLGSSLPFTAFAARVPGPPSDPWPFPLTRPPSLMANFYCFLRGRVFTLISLKIYLLNLKPHLATTLVFSYHYQTSYSVVI